MEIKELVLKNFGKFLDKSICFSSGINLIYGVNEAGKTTIHTFLKSMLFGMERSRGRGAANDTFSRYEPWYNPNYYAGRIRFSCGMRNFCLERNFDKYAKNAVLYCEDDGETLSVEHGDLEMLLNGMTETDYVNTVSIGQMRAATTQALAAELKDYAANYYATGNGEMNLSAAIELLNLRKKEIEKEIREQGRKKQEKREKLESELSYIWRDMHRLEKEIEQVEKAWDERRDKFAKKEEELRVQGENEKKKGIFSHWRIHPVESFVMLAAIILSFTVFKRPWNFLVTVVVALASGLHLWNRMKDGKKEQESENKKQNEQKELAGEDEKFRWRVEKLQEDYREKKIQYENLREKLDEMDEISNEAKGLEKHRRAFEIAANQMNSLSGDMQKMLGQKINRRVSEILSEVTKGAYESVWVDDTLKVWLLAQGKKISMEQVSKGTLEQIYFALRMAASEILHDEEFPVIFDDAFAYYDDERLQLVLEWLERNRQQVIIFTCQKREEEILKRFHIPYHKVELKRS